MNHLPSSQSKYISNRQESPIKEHENSQQHEEDSKSSETNSNFCAQWCDQSTRAGRREEEGGGGVIAVGEERSSSSQWSCNTGRPLTLRLGEERHG